MTIECSGYFDEKGNIHNSDPKRLEPMRRAHKQGEYVRIIFDDSVESEHVSAFKKFHALRDEFSDATGYDKEEAKALLKSRHGKCIPYIDGFVPPVGERGEFFEVSGRILWLKSTTVMNTDELMKLILGTERDIAEA
jgi:hypothetical protein